MDKILRSDEFTLTCDHTFHLHCVNGYVTSQIEANKIPIKCLEPKCKEIFQDYQIMMFVDQKTYDSYIAASLRSFVSLNAGTLIQCPTPDCPNIFEFEGDKSQKFSCLLCGNSYCLNCKVKFHEKMTCAEYKQYPG